jgi:hypothetical protein
MGIMDIYEVEHCRRGRWELEAARFVAAGDADEAAYKVTGEHLHSEGERRKVRLRVRKLGNGSPPPKLFYAAWGGSCRGFQQEKQPGAYRGGTTNFVHFRETPYGLAMSLVENRRENDRICHEHVASLGSIETPPSVAARIEFWRGLRERMGQLSNRLDAETRGKVMVAVHARVPMVPPEEQPAS